MEAKIGSQSQDKKSPEVKNKNEGFSAQFLHDLKTPVMVIGGYAKRLRAGKAGTITDEQKGALDIIIQNCEKLERDLRMILEFAQSNNDSTEPITLEPFNLKAVLRNQLRNFKPRARKKKIALKLDLPFKPVKIQADSRMIDKAVSNLIDNAIKYTDTGGRVFVALSVSENCVEIKVSDNGKGLNQNEKQLIFKPFEQMANTTGRENQGVGLGLANVKRYIELHQGEIKVESEIGQGSSFIIRLPKLQSIDA
jgi:signal transduction histidine kinase